MTIDKSNITGVLLAGGQSRRMGGGDKGLLTLDGKTMLQRVVDRFSPQVGALVINANGDPARFADYRLPVVADSIEGFVGPLAGVLAGMRWAARHTPGARLVATTSTDAPFLPRDLVLRLANEQARSGGIALAASGGEMHPVIGLWPVALADDLEAALTSGVRKVLHWTDRHGTHPVDFPLLEVAGRKVDPFFNANTPEELAEAASLVCHLT